MKKMYSFIKLSLLSFSLLFFAQSFQAQDYLKVLKKAKKMVGKYEADPEANAGLLIEAQQITEDVFENNSDISSFDAWFTKASVYSALADKDYKAAILGQPTSGQTFALTAFDALKKSKSLATKGYHKKDANNGLINAANHLNNLGADLYGAQRFEEAYKAFNGILEIKEILNADGIETVLGTDEDYQNQLYSTGLMAMQGNMMEEATPLFNKLYDSGYSEAGVYEAMYKINKDENPEKAVKYLEEGRTKHPEEVSLLFAEINHYLATNQVDQLTGKLEIAISKDPGNKTLYTTLGNVYDQQYASASSAGDMEGAQKNFDLAMSNYEKALEVDPQYAVAVYSIGALYYNKAASLTNELKILEADYSKEGTKKYEAKKSEVYKAFDQALPFFKKAESMDPNDRNTLIALKEIYARQDNFEVSNEFKARLETLESGGTVDGSYFKD